MKIQKSACRKLKAIFPQALGSKNNSFPGASTHSSLESCLARGETPQEDALKKLGTQTSMLVNLQRLDAHEKVTPVAFCGKPHNSLPGVMHGDKPCGCRPGIPQFQSWEGVNDK
jgi:hypothetical protein